MKETEFDKDLRKGIAAEHRREWKENLRSLEASLAEPKKTSTRFNFRIAASVAVLIGLASGFFLFNQNPSSEELYHQYFTPYENVVEPVVRDQVELSKKAQAFAYYEQGNYEKSIAIFQGLTPQDSLTFSVVQFYQANAYMRLNEFETAQKLFEQVVDQNKEWKEESLWYLALISLKSNDEDTAISYLKKLQQNGTVFKREVKALLETLQ